MTSSEIVNEPVSTSTDRWLREIALQLAVRNEQVAPPQPQTPAMPWQGMNWNQETAEWEKV